MTVTTTSTNTPAGGNFWQVLSGHSYCEIVDGGRCVTDGPDYYGHNERCEVKALRPLYVTAEQYTVEKTHDYVTINGFKYDQLTPRAVKMNKGATWSWTTDQSYRFAGFKLCASATMPETSAGTTKAP